MYFYLIQNGHSIEELARVTNNQDIIEAIRRSRSTLKQEGQFIDLLSSYLEKDSDASAAKKEVRILCQKYASCILNVSTRGGCV